MPDGGRYARKARGMRLYGALAVLRRSRGGEGDMRADGARRDRGEIARGYTRDMMPTERRYSGASAGLLLLSTRAALPFLTNC